MSKGQEQRQSQRLRIRIHNAVRMITDEGDCIADIIDINETGIGLGYYDFFCALNLVRGSVVQLRVILDIDGDIIVHSRTQESNSPGLDDQDDPDFVMVEATVVWSYLNRIGLTFNNGPQPGLVKAIREFGDKGF